MVKNSFFRRFSIKVLNIKELPVIFLTTITIIILGNISPTFFTLSNWVAIINSLPIIILPCIFMTILLIEKAFDLSIGSVAAVSGAICGILLLKGLPVFICILLALCVGFIFGLVNGFFVTKLGIAPFIVTLATMTIGRGLVYVLLKGKNISGFPENFYILGQGRIFNLEYPVYLSVIIIFFAWFILRYFRFSKTIYYIGDSSENAKLLGINVGKIQIISFIGSGILGSITGLVIISRYGAASNQAGIGLELLVIIACVIGGTSIYGGEGGLLGTVIGAFFLALLTNGFNLLATSIYWKDFLLGIILIFAIALDTFRKEMTRIRL